MQEEEDDVLRARMNAGRIMAATMTTNATVTAAILNFLDLRVITPNDPAQAGRASEVLMLTDARSRPCLQPDGWAARFSCLFTGALALSEIPAQLYNALPRTDCTQSKRADHTTPKFVWMTVWSSKCVSTAHHAATYAVPKLSMN